ncbi:tripartite motif-containing protein 16-like [Antennarius striatus]|uniref:tripartite motif-containing protein 16-like n=1 Tax=Antennarius striatus TaxID=241820 RepID=UPI0035AF6971
MAQKEEGRLAAGDHCYAGPEAVQVSPVPSCENHLQVSQRDVQQRIQDRQKYVKELQQEVEAINRSADQAVEDSEKIFTELIRLMEERRHDVKKQVRSQQQQEVGRVKELQNRKEKEIEELEKIDAEVEQLPPTEDHIQLLEKCLLSDPRHSSNIGIHPLRYFEDVAAVVSKLRDEVHDVLSEGWTDISVSLPAVILSEPEPKTRSEFFKYSREITLDPNTANTQLLLSEDNRKVMLMRERQGYSSHPDRFTYYGQVLSQESLTGRCYWEVDWGDGEGGVAVVYKNITRDGGEHESLFGRNDQSWMLYCNSDNYQFYHNTLVTPVSGPWSSRVGVYLDHTAGVLAFYSVSQLMTLLHRVQTTFTKPLYAGLRPCFYGTTAELCQLKETEVPSGIYSNE